MNPRAIRFLLAALAAALAIACTPGGGTIYYVLEHEVKTVDNTLPNDITVYAIASAGAGGLYYAAAGKIWEGVAGAGTVTWDTAEPVEPPVAGALCNALTHFGGTLFGGFAGASGNLGLYRSDATPSPSFAGSSSLLATGVQVVRLKAENPGTPTLAVVVVDGAFDYDVLLSTDGEGFDSIDFASLRAAGESQKPIVDVIWAGAPFNRWFVTEGTRLYSGAGPLDTVEPMTGVTLSSSDELRDLYYDGSLLYVTSKLGALYVWDGASNWTKKTAPEVSGATPALTAIAGPVGADILVGSDGYGYYLYDGASLARMSSTTYSTVKIYGASVRRLLLDPAPPAAAERLFVGTAGRGLWRAESPSATMSWIQE